MINLPNDRLELLIYLSKNLEEVSFEHGCLLGKFNEGSNFSFDQVKLKLIELNLYKIHDNNELEINLPDNFFHTLSDYLEKPERRLLESIPDKFYISEFDFLCINQDFSSAPSEIINFFNTSRLFDSICKVSDYIGSNHGEKNCILYFKEQIEVTNIYSVSQLVEIENLDIFINEYINDSIHKEQKRGIVRNVIFEMYNKKIDVSGISKDFEVFFKKIRDGYELYISEFSFESFKNELDDLKRDYILKINKIFTDVQNQVLTIPLATIVATSQMKTFKGDYSNLFINIFIVFGVFCFLLYLKWY